MSSLLFSDLQEIERERTRVIKRVDDARFSGVHSDDLIVSIKIDSLARMVADGCLIREGHRYYTPRFKPTKTMAAVALERPDYPKEDLIPW